MVYKPDIHMFAGQRFKYPDCDRYGPCDIPAYDRDRCQTCRNINIIRAGDISQSFDDLFAVLSDSVSFYDKSYRIDPELLSRDRDPEVGYHFVDPRHDRMILVEAVFLYKNGSVSGLARNA